MTIFNMPYRLFLLCGIAASMLVGSLWVLGVRAPMEAAIGARGHTVTAVVTGISEPYDPTWRRRDGKRYDVFYRFTTGAGEVVEDDFSRNWFSRNRMRKGQQFDVIYLPEDPSWHVVPIVGRLDPRPTFWMAIAFGIVIVGICAWEARRLPRGWKPRFWPPLSAGPPK